MTRRAEAEAMLAKYGNEAACGGETFPAFIRPMRFQSGAGRNTPDDFADGMRFSYFGPAAHKLSVGGTVTSGGADYTVKRCETVCLAGEELFVRAVLAPLSPSAETDVRLERSGKAFAHAESYTAQAISNAEGVVPWGESAPAEIAEGAVTWKITLKGLRAETGADLFSPDAFDIAAERKDGTTIYSGCRWTLLRNTGGPAAQNSCMMEALAAERRKEANANG